MSTDIKKQFHVALAELYYAAGDCALEGDLDGVKAALRADDLVFSNLKLKERAIYDQAHIRFLSCGERKIQVIKTLRTFYDSMGWKLSLVAAKGVVETEGCLLPDTRPGSADKPLLLKPEACEMLRSRLQNVGAEVAVEPCSEGGNAQHSPGYPHGPYLR